jgi:hypothetical protein
MIMCRFGSDWANLFKYDSKTDSTIIISKGLLLDMCPFTAFFVCFALIIDPTRKIAT